MQAMSSTQGSHTPTNQRATHGRHGLKGPQAPQLPQNCVHTWDRLEDPPDNHHKKAQVEVGTQGVGRTDLVAAHPSLPHGASWLVPKSIPRVFAVLSRRRTGI
jgi:hypothetical protein